jgi:hypothetical protein
MVTDTNTCKYALKFVVNASDSQVDDKHFCNKVWQTVTKRDKEWEVEGGWSKFFSDL